MCPGNQVEKDGKDVCAPVGTGVSGRCKCIEKTIVVQRRYDCVGDWDLELMAECALEGGICLVLCYLFPEPASCADCLAGVDLECCGGDGCTPCDFRDCYKDVKTEVEVEGSVFDYFEGDSCGG